MTLDNAFSSVSNSIGTYPEINKNIIVINVVKHSDMIVSSLSPALIENTLSKSTIVTTQPYCISGICNNPP